MKILITGVAGLVGSSLAKNLTEHEIIGVDNLIGGYIDNIPKPITWINKDCANLTSNDFEGVDVVVHAACTPHEGLSIFSPKLITDNTFGISINVLKCSIEAGVKKFVYLSSMARYGTQKTLPFVETMDPKPQDPYGVSKVAFEKILEILSAVHGIDYSIVVPHNIVGRGQVYTDPFRNVAGIMINRMLQGNQPIIYGDGSQMRCFSDIRDVVAPLTKVVTTDAVNGQVVNIGPDESYITVLDLAKTTARLLSFPLDPIYLPERPAEVKHANCSADKARSLLGYSTTFSLEETLLSMIEWVKERGPEEFRFDLPVELKHSSTPKTWIDPLIFNPK